MELQGSSCAREKVVHTPGGYAIEGQIKALKRSLEKTDTSDCTQTLFQLKAATNGLKRFGEAFAREYASRCMKAGKSKTELSKDIDQIISTAFTLS